MEREQSQLLVTPGSCSDWNETYLSSLSGTENDLVPDAGNFTDKQDHFSGTDMYHHHGIVIPPVTVTQSEANS